MFRLLYVDKQRSLIEYCTSFPSCYINYTQKIYSQLSRSDTARGSCTGLVTVAPTKVLSVMTTKWLSCEDDPVLLHRVISM